MRIKPVAIWTVFMLLLVHASHADPIDLRNKKGIPKNLSNDNEVSQKVIEGKAPPIPQVKTRSPSDVTQSSGAVSGNPPNGSFNSANPKHPMLRYVPGPRGPVAAP